MSAHCLQRTFLYPLAEGYPCRHHSSFESFTKALEHGCWVCLQLEAYASPELQESNFEALYYQLKECTKGEDSLHKTFYRLSFLLGRRNFYFLIEAVRPWRRLHDIAETTKLEFWTGDEDTAELAQGWLTHCQEEHSSCSRHVTPNWYPTRLLDLSKDSILLRHSSTEQLSGSYATLSHCWGKKPFWVLSSDTLDMLMRGIPLSSFPNTFQQAIITVRRLGIQYLWIDCYCIIQGSDPSAQADWEREAARMGQVYSNSLINIGAAQASGPDEGLFSVRSTKDIKRVAIEWRPYTNHEREHFYLTIDGIENSFDQVWHRLHGAPLAKRGWIIQECALCPRMLSFNGPEIFWQCSELAACGNFPIDNGHLYSPTQYPFWALTDFDDPIRNSSQLKYIKAQRKPNDFQDQLLERWTWLMASYCLSSLTYPDKDIFKALDGIGDRVAQMTGDVYQHGLLEKSLPQALLWAADNLYCHPSPSQRAPTWHWASYKGHQTFRGTRALTYERNEHGESSYSTSLAYLFMSKECRTFASDPVTDLWPSLFCVGRLIMPSGEQFLLKELMSSAEKSGNMYGVIALKDNGGQLQDEIGYRKDSGRPNYSSMKELFYLPLAGEQTAPNANSRTSKKPRPVIYPTYGLILQRSDKGTFQRVGIFHRHGVAFKQRMQATQPRLIELR